MSDSVTNVDVEDVLSSIRRLVTDTNSDARSTSDEQEKQAEDSSDATGSEALLLTSALRVPASTDAADDSVQAGEAEMCNLRDAVSQSGSDDAPTQDWPSAEADEYYEDDVPDDMAPVINFVRHDHFEHAGQPDQSDDGGEDISDDEFDEIVAADEATEGGPAWTGEGDPAREEPIAPDQDRSDEASHDWAAEDIQDTEADQDQQDPSEHDDDAAEDIETGESAMPSWLEAGHAEISEAELVEADSDADLSAVKDQDDDSQTDASDWAVDDAQDDESAGADQNADPQMDHEPEVIFASAAAASVIGDDEASADAQSADPDLADFEDDVIDEDALRDLVAEIVREELTGELGERITRNVRKLVRREIHRAMLTREFE